MPRDIAISEFGRAERWRSLIAVIASVFGVGVSFGALVPLIALILERRGVDAAVIGLNSAMFPLAVLLFTRVLVPRSRSSSRRRSAHPDPEGWRSCSTTCSG